MGRPAGVKNGQGKKAAAKKGGAKKGTAATSETVDREAPAMAAAPVVKSNGPDAAEKRKYLEEYRNHRRRLADIMQEAADERGNGRSTLKAFENKGGSPKMLKRMWELTDMSKGEAEAEVSEYLGYAVDIGIRVSFDASGQGSLDDVLPAAPAPQPTTDAEKLLSRSRSYNDGWNTAKAGGVVTDNKYHAGTQEHQEWAHGFSDYIWEQDNGPRPVEAEPPAPESESVQSDVMVH